MNKNFYEVKEGEYFYIQLNHFYNLYRITNGQVEHISHYWTIKDMKDFIKSNK